MHEWYSAVSITLIAAMADNRVIGRDLALIWHLPEDLKHFREKTLGKSVLMGRKTWDSLGRALPQRQNIVLTRDTNFVAEGALVCHSHEAVAQAIEGKELMVIGGGEIYELFLPIAQKIYLTHLHARFEGDTYFPELELGAWRETSREQKWNERDGWRYDFVTYERH